MHLKLDKNNGYRVMQVTDLHFGEDEERDGKTIAMIRDIIRKESPDFLAVTGDLISGQMYDMSDENSNFWEEYFDRFFGIMNSYDLPWGFVPGYHDYETGWSNEKMMQKIIHSHLHSDVGNNFQYLD
jgi:predicted MPP superfamily phosphohydrolase